MSLKRTYWLLLNLRICFQVIGQNVMAVNYFQLILAFESNLTRKRTLWVHKVFTLQHLEVSKAVKSREEVGKCGSRLTRKSLLTWLFSVNLNWLVQHQFQKTPKCANITRENDNSNFAGRQKISMFLQKHKFIPLPVFRK